MISFIIPAHNEALLLPQTLKAIDESSADLGEQYEIIVVDDDSTDDTGVVARQHGAHVLSVRCRQISATRNAGAREAQGDVFVFVDADTTITPEVVRAALRAIREGAVGGGCAVHFDGWIPRWARILQPIATWMYRVVGMAAGCFLFCNRIAFTDSGGFDEGIFAGEEATMSWQLKRLGRFVVLREHVVTSGRKLRAYSGTEIARTLGRLAVLGRKGVNDRRHLELWYGPRRADPD